jgi:hypothetical protein
LARLAHSSPACLSHIHGQEHNVEGHICMCVKTSKPCQKTSEKPLHQTIANNYNYSNYNITNTLCFHNILYYNIFYYIVLCAVWCPSAPSETSHPTMPPLSHGSCQSWQRRRCHCRHLQAPRAQGSAEQRGAQGSWKATSWTWQIPWLVGSREYNSWYIYNIYNWNICGI